MAIGAIQELQAAGIRVPADISVTGFDDIYLGAMLTPPLTTVHQPMRLLGERACSLLLERIADPGLPRRVERLPTEARRQGKLRLCGGTASRRDLAAAVGLGEAIDHGPELVGGHVGTKRFRAGLEPDTRGQRPGQHGVEA